MSLRRNRRAKIVATLGPASSDRDTLRSLFHAGVDVFRLNFSHGSAEDHAVRMAILREIEAETGRPIGVMADLQGPKLRVGAFAQGRCSCSPASASAWTWTRAPATPSASACPTRDLRRAGARRRAAAGRRPPAPARRRLRRDQRGYPGAGGRTAVRTQGRQRAGRGAADLRAHAQDLRDLDTALALGADWIALSRAAARGHHRGPRTDRRPRPHHRQAGEALGGRAAGRDHRPGRRADGGARRPGRGTAGRTGARDPEARARLPPRRQAGDRRHADAGIHDREPRAHARRGLRRGHRHLRRRGRRHAVGRIRHRQASAGRGRDDEPHHRGHRGRSAVPPADRRLAFPAVPGQSDTAQAVCCAMRHAAALLKAAAICFSSGATSLRAARERPEAPVLSLTPSLARAAADAGVGRAFRACGRRGRHRAVHRLACAVATQERFCSAGQTLAIIAGMPFGKAGTTNLLRIATA